MNENNIVEFQPDALSIAMLGTFPPRRCGIATFSADLTEHLEDLPGVKSVEVYAMDDGSVAEYGHPVVHLIRQETPSSYRQAAHRINSGVYDALSVQHEYGIFGGLAGGHLLDLLREVRVPIVLTLHTVLAEPTPDQRRVLEALLALSARVVVMSQKAVRLLKEVHGFDSTRVILIPHGIPSVDTGLREAIRAERNLTGPFLMTFGLLSPDKGVEQVIRAMPAILDRHPDACYMVVGATHPHQVSAHGETYRESLQSLTQELDVSHAVRFVNRFMPKIELVRLLGAMDIYVTPYLKRDQITSGTLAYALGAGKAVISTPYWYAEEVLAEGRGSLVPFRDSQAIADAVLDLLSDSVRREAMSAAAEAYSKAMLWPSVAAQYLAVFRECRVKRSLVGAAATNSQTLALPMPRLRLEHLLAMSDDTGLLQHATHTVPNRHEGYSVDDNARALLLTALLEKEHALPSSLDGIQRNTLAFLVHAQHPKTGRFRNFMDYSRQWLEEAGSEDSHGRCMWALGAMVAYAKNTGYRRVAEEAWQRGLDPLLSLGSLRAWAYGILGIGLLPERSQAEPRVQAALEDLAGRLMAAARYHSAPDWPWFENTLSYANPRLSQALIVAGTLLGDPEMRDAGINSLGWLARLQSGRDGEFLPVSTEGRERGQAIYADFDQQPIEAWAMTSAAITAYEATLDTRWLAEARRAVAWFHGENVLHLPLVDAASGGCHDGLQEDRVSRNEGAESTLALLIAQVEWDSVAARRSAVVSMNRDNSLYTPLGA